ncbi:MAG: hypothetical protein UV68_C0056G0004 [Candidatus Collierbacteria bacterium GW2011_GWC2_43_12]|uniref:Major facilitator superfamily (MFS) profile domain-containing protein n=1 Tax=Candidatus Collierbacteria bacterium GW2011_GWC2_43_12 TaxID=1618390 RepID=A0A0G1D1V4_9BACT|nr:MAG: hypothetical protein UV68_C0056G0004 [Candidatus Collierbacteria bacterium GW2011_GWC2_43_12]
MNRKVVILSVMLFFLYLGDGILSDWVPSFIQGSTKSSITMGLIISFSSVVGFLADLVFPGLLKKLKTKKLMLMAIGTSLLFCGILLWMIAWPILLLFLFSMAVWGLYYEFLGFGSQQFVSESVPLQSRSGVWAIMGVFRSLAYFLGPIIGSYVALSIGNSETVWVAVASVIVGLLIWLSWGKRNTNYATEITKERFLIWQEVKRWKTLSVHVWPILVISVVMGIVDATFWTTGTVLSDSMARDNWLGGMFLPAYMLPMVFVGIIVAKWGIYRGKKKIAETFMLVAGLLLAALSFNDSSYFMLLVSLLSGAALSIAWPMTEAVYSDITERMGYEGKHMMGLSSSTLSLAYIIGPVMAGGIAQLVGERLTFSVMGILMALVALILLIVTPRKLRLPQSEIQAWD